jgi:hypothetical protein
VGVGQPHDIVDSGNTGHGEPAGLNIGGRVKQIDIRQIHRPEQVQQGARPVGCAFHHNISGIGGAAERHSAQRVAQENKVQIGRKTGQIINERLHHLSNAAGLRADIAAINRNSVSAQISSVQKLGRR